jgi:hypothetical protein
LLLCALAAGTAHSQAVLFDFEEGSQGWGSYGAITTDSGDKFGDYGFGRYHIGDFSQPDQGNFGIVDISPPGQNLAAYGGMSVNARLVDVPGFDPYVGEKLLDLVLATGTDPNEHEFFAPAVTMTDQWQTFSVPFSEFQSNVTGLAPSAADLADIRIKLVVFNVHGTGIAELNYDEILGLAKTAVPTADFDADGDVDGQDFVAWQRGFGTGTTRAQGDADNNSVVNAADLAVWKSQFGSPPPAASGNVLAVPEPSAVVLGAGSLALAALGRRRRRC